MDLRAIVFDYGMVLSAPADPAAHRELVETTGVSVETFDKYYWANRDDYDSGALTGDSYWEKFARDAGIALTPHQMGHLVATDACMWMSLNEPVLAWARQVRASGVKIGILSNIGDALVREMRRQFGWIGDFDHSTWSCEVGMVKPEEAIYRYTVEKLGVESHQALFLDDKPVNIRGAEAIGMRGIVFTSLEQLAEDLKARGLGGRLPMPTVPAAQEA